MNEDKRVVGFKLTNDGSIFYNHILMTCIIFKFRILKPIQWEGW